MVQIRSRNRYRIVTCQKNQNQNQNRKNSYGSATLVSEHHHIRFCRSGPVINYLRISGQTNSQLGINQKSMAKDTLRVKGLRSPIPSRQKLCKPNSDPDTNIFKAGAYPCKDNQLCTSTYFCSISTKTNQRQQVNQKNLKTH